MEPLTCQVEAPADLPEGFVFDAVVDGILFSVTVPAGGVKRGQVLRVPYPRKTAATSATFTTAAQPTTPAAQQPARGMSGGSGTMDPEIYIPSPSLPPPVMPSVATFIPTVIAEPIPASAANNNNNGAMTVTTVHRPDGTIVTETIHPDGTKTVVTKTTVSPANNNYNANGGMAGGAGTNTTPQSGAPNNNNNNSVAVAPTGQWTTELCSCFDVCCSGVWWMSWVCLPILSGQVMQRMRFTMCGCPGPCSRFTCFGVTFLWALAWIVAFGSITQTFAIIGSVLPAYVLYLFVALSCTRKQMRSKYKIPPSCCRCCGGGGECGLCSRRRHHVYDGTEESCLDDCCCVYCCSCCVVLQMHRHTHSPREYPYQLVSVTGLPRGAPAIV